MPKRAETKRERFEIQWTQLKNEQASFMSHWQDLADHIQPRRARAVISDKNRGDRRNLKIVDTTATLAARTLRSGMMGGVTSPARPWFRLAVPDQAMAENQVVKTWLYDVAQKMSNVFLKSNLYQTLPIIYGDMGTFGTAAMLIEEDVDNVVRFYAFEAGSFLIATNDRGKVDVFMREFQMTVRQIVQKFVKRTGTTYDWSNVSEYIREQFEDGHLNTSVDVRHIIVPNPDYDERKLLSKFKRFSSVYYEAGRSGSKSGYLSPKDDDRYLSEMGYDHFPVLCPRWEVASGDAYGTSCPGMDALGDIKALQVMQKRKAQAIEKMVNPPMTGPTSLIGADVSIIPGHVTYVDETGQGQGFRPAHLVNPNVRELLMDIQDHQSRVDKAFYANLFLMLANDTRSGTTAREIDERHEEKLLALGPVLEQLNQDLLDPLIDITFAIMDQRSRDAKGGYLEDGLIPPPPEEVINRELKVEYISVMAQAQKMVGLAGIQNFYQIVGQLMGNNPEVAQKLNWLQGVDVLGEILSVPPQLIFSDEDVQAKQAAQAKQQQAQAQMAQMQQMAGAAKDLSQTDLEGNNALKYLVDQGNAGRIA